MSTQRASQSWHAGEAPISEHGWPSGTQAAASAALDYEPAPAGTWQPSAPADEHSDESQVTGTYAGLSQQAWPAQADEAYAPGHGLYPPDYASQVAAIGSQHETLDSPVARINQAYELDALQQAEQHYEQTPVGSWRRNTTAALEPRPTTMRAHKRRSWTAPITAGVVVLAIVLGYSAARIQSWREKHGLQPTAAVVDSPRAAPATGALAAPSAPVAPTEPAREQSTAADSSTRTHAPQHARRGASIVDHERSQRGRPNDALESARMAASQPPAAREQDGEPRAALDRSADREPRASAAPATPAPNGDGSASAAPSLSAPAATTASANASLGRNGQPPAASASADRAASEASASADRAASAASASADRAASAASASADRAASAATQGSADESLARAGQPPAASASADRAASAAPSAANASAERAASAATQGSTDESLARGGQPSAASASPDRAAPAAPSGTVNPTRDVQPSAAPASPSLERTGEMSTARASAAPANTAQPSAAVMPSAVDRNARASAALASNALGRDARKPAGSASSAAAPAPAHAPAASATPSPMNDALDRAVEPRAPAGDAVLAMVDEVTQTPAAAPPPSASAEPVDPHAPKPVLTIRPLDSAGASGAHTQPTRDQVRDAILAMQPQLALCAGDKHGTTHANVTIQGNGRVSYSLIDGAFAGTEAGSCMARVLRAAIFPSFSGPPFKVRYPLLF